MADQSGYLNPDFSQGGYTPGSLATLTQPMALPILTPQLAG